MLHWTHHHTFFWKSFNQNCIFPSLPAGGRSLQSDSACILVKMKHLQPFVSHCELASSFYSVVSRSQSMPIVFHFKCAHQQVQSLCTKFHCSLKYQAGSLLSFISKGNKKDASNSLSLIAFFSSALVSQLSLKIIW